MSEGQGEMGNGGGKSSHGKEGGGTHKWCQEHQGLSWLVAPPTSTAAATTVTTKGRWYKPSDGTTDSDVRRTDTRSRGEHQTIFTTKSVVFLQVILCFADFL